MNDDPYKLRNLSDEELYGRAFSWPLGPPDEDRAYFISGARELAARLRAANIEIERLDAVIEGLPQSPRDVTEIATDVAGALRYMGYDPPREAPNAVILRLLDVAIDD